jgi:hypothetical protein
MTKKKKQKLEKHDYVIKKDVYVQKKAISFSAVLPTYLFVFVLKKISTSAWACRNISDRRPLTCEKKAI